MTLVVPTATLNVILNEILNRPNLKLKLYSNNVTPDSSSSNGDFTEVSGGGYAEVALDFSNWIIAVGVATYNQITFTFSGVTNAPGTIYGYWIVDEDDSTFIWAERLPEGILPFTPVDGSTGLITPRLVA